MLYAAFETVEQAITHRSHHGGWIFIPEEGTGSPIWFCLKFTATMVMKHQATNGLNGTLI